MWKTDVGFLLSFDDLLLAILDVDAVGRGVLYPLAAEIIGGTVGRVGCAYRPDGRAGIVLCERIALPVVGLDLQRCWREFFNDELEGIVAYTDMKFVVVRNIIVCDLKLSCPLFYITTMPVDICHIHDA